MLTAFPATSLGTASCTGAKLRIAFTPARTSRSTTSCADSAGVTTMAMSRSEEHTSELQSLAYLVCRLLLEKKKNKANWRAQLTDQHSARCQCHDTNQKTC